MNKRQEKPKRFSCLFSFFAALAAQTVSIRIRAALEAARFLKTENYFFTGRTSIIRDMAAGERTRV